VFEPARDSFQPGGYGRVEGAGGRGVRGEGSPLFFLSHPSGRRGEKPCKQNLTQQAADAGADEIEPD